MGKEQKAHSFDLFDAAATRRNARAPTAAMLLARSTQPNELKFSISGTITFSHSDRKQVKPWSYFTRSVRQFQFPECKQYAVRTSVSVLYLDRCTASINLKTNNHESMILKTAVSAIR